MPSRPWSRNYSQHWRYGDGETLAAYTRDRLTQEAWNGWWATILPFTIRVTCSRTPASLSSSRAERLHLRDRGSRALAQAKLRPVERLSLAGGRCARHSPAAELVDDMEIALSRYSGA